QDFRDRAAALYAAYESTHARRFRWLRPELFSERLAADLYADAEALMNILDTAGEWDPDKDEKLAALHRLLTAGYPDEKVIVFTQFADTVRYLARELKR